jgi:hypothetical protein
MKHNPDILVDVLKHIAVNPSFGHGRGRNKQENNKCKPMHMPSSIQSEYQSYTGYHES